MFKSISRSFFLTAFLITASACTMDLTRFGEITSPSLGDNDDDQHAGEIKGSFPLGKAAFGTGTKTKIRRSTDGKFVMFDPFKNQVRIYTAEGRIVKEIQLIDDLAFYPQGMGVDSQGVIYVAARDQRTVPHREYVLKFANDGTPLGIFKEFSEEGGMLPHVEQIYFDSSDNLYFGMTYYGQVRRYNKSTGNLMTTYGLGTGTGNGQFDGMLTAFAVDPTGYIWATDYNTNRLQKLKPDGSYDTQIAWPRTSSAAQVGDIAVLSNGNILMAERDGTMGRFLAIDTSGSLIYSQDGTMGGGPAFAANHIVSFSVVGNEIFTVLGPSVRVFDRDTAAPIRSYEATISMALGVMRDNVGNTYVSDTTGLKRFDKTGFNDLLITAGIYYDFNQDSSGKIYVADVMNSKILIYSTDGTSLGQFPAGGMVGFIDIHKNASEEIIYAADSGNGLIRKFSLTGVNKGSISHPDVIAPINVIVTADEELVILDTTSTAFGSPARALVKLDKNGSKEWEIPMGQQGLQASFGLASDASGKIYVADMGANKIIKLNADGTLNTTFSGPGANLGELSQPTGIILDTAGNIYVAEAGNNRVQKFSAAGVVQTE